MLQIPVKIYIMKIKREHVCVPLKSEGNGMNVVLGIVMILIAAALGFFGYMIAMRGKYALVTNYVMERHAGKVDSAYAQRVGWIELFAAAYFLLFGILALFFSNAFAWTVIIVGVVLFVAAALLNLFLGKRMS